MTVRACIERFARAEGGATAVEMALIAPLLMLLTVGTMQAGRLAWTQAALNFAVEEAARCVSVRPDLCGTPTQTASYAAGKMTGLKVDATAFTVSTQPCGAQVSAQLPYSLKIAFGTVELVALSSFFSLAGRERLH